jgi:ubiquitin carboxyl-terminal hydrolase 9/24
MTESGMKWVDRFFKAVNAQEGQLVARRKMNDVGLIGHEDLIASCIDCLRANSDELQACIYKGQQIHETAVLDKYYANRSRQVTARMCRLLKLLHEYVSDYDCEFQMRGERTILPLERAYRY